MISNLTTISHIGLQCYQQRACPYEHPREERHHPDRCHSLPPMVRGPRTFCFPVFFFIASMHS
jgi:hypothetical protein